MINIEVDNRDDDDETLARCTKPRTVLTAYRPSPNTVDLRIRNLSAFGHWRAAPKMKIGKGKQFTTMGKPDILTKYLGGFLLSRGESCLVKSIYPHLMEGFTSKAYLILLTRAAVVTTAVQGASSSVAGQQVPPETKSRDCNVKLSIKSLKVPELFIEISATATVGSLKTFMEAMTSILGDGLHVGVLLQGKAVRDDGKTLLQTGISHNDKHHRLHFMLEPNHQQITPPLRTEDSHLLYGGTCQGLTGHTASLPVQLATSDDSPLPRGMNSDSQALDAVPAVSMEALAVVPFRRKPNPHEFVKCRTRRPFSVSEVEALVQAVEELGTGRINGRHWCTQQRRGEPVPQQLLDRVLAAHAFWSQQQAKQLVKVEA